ncbi:MAG: hypothetical protein NXH70_08925 [Hyphomonas sp.]|nr:hypothetical protein [Hyphomonas sp.]
MIDAIRDAIAANQAEAATYSSGVRIWMTVMALSFFSSVLFVAWKAGARWILFAVLINIAGLITIKAANPEFSRTEIGTMIHLVFWSFALFMIWRPGAKNVRAKDFSGRSGAIYLPWLIIVSLIMSASLVLDARTALSWVFT